MGNTNTAAKPRHRMFGDRLQAVLAAVTAAGLAVTLGSGFMLQSTVDVHTASKAATAELRESAELEKTQLAVGNDVLLARAAGAADQAIADAEAAVAAANGKTDASALTTTLAQLSAFEMLPPARVFALVESVRAQSADVTTAVAEFDRAEAERVAAEEAARVAAEQAAAERAAAERAAADAANPGSGGQQTGGPPPPANPSEAQQIAREMGAARYGWGDDQFGCLVAVWDYESHWNVYAANSNGAYGIPQALPGSKMASHGADWQTNPATQISWGIDYIAGRYGNPCGAWAHIQSAGWY